jgi:hypothetical protein
METLIAQTSVALYANRVITDLTVPNGGQCAASRCRRVGAIGKESAC